MNEELARAKLLAAEKMVNTQLARALQRARAYAEKNVKYKWGSKSEEELDCSGLMVKCYPLLFEGTEKQRAQLKDWLFEGSDISIVEQGDIIFFAERTTPTKVSHVGIVEGLEGTVAGIIHSSESRGGVVRDDFNISENAFRNDYIAVAVAKMRPFLFRRFLNDEIMRSVQDVR